MYDEPVLLPDGKEVLFSLYRKKECIASDKREYELLLGAYSDMSEVLGSMVIQGRPFKEVIMDDRYRTSRSRLKVVISKMYFHSSYPFFVKVMSSSENIWAVFGIQHICNIAMHKFPIYCLYRIHKRSQRDNIYNSKRFMAF